MARGIACFALLATLAFAAAGPPVETSPRYRIEQLENVVVSTRPGQDHNGFFVTLRFCIRNQADDKLATDIARDAIRVEEDGLPVDVIDFAAPAAEPLHTVLALDISGSMAAESKWKQAREAAHNFLDRLDSRSDTGLILFDHEIRVSEHPAADPKDFAAHRAIIRQHVDAAVPGGGTAYLDAVANGIDMLKGISGRRAVVLMTDGVDMNSTMRLSQVIRKAEAEKIPIYTIGIGEPGKNEPVTTVLVLDQSGSMRQKANEHDSMTKIEALRTAASHFIDLMRPNASTTLLPFSSEVDSPAPFTADKESLKQVIKRLRPRGGTLLYDATFVAVETLAAARLPGRKAVVVLTDGQDEQPGSDHSDSEVIDAANREHIALHMLGLGRPQEINEPVMRRMADKTNGSYHHAGDPKQLIQIFETLCIDLHDDGIDEESLRQLAGRSGGRYVHARDLSKLSELFGTLADELQNTYTVTFASRRPSHDGSSRDINIRIVRDGVQLSDTASTGYKVHGVVVPEMDAGVYLGLLALLGGLLAAPAALARLKRQSAADRVA
jgi:VWFA-related protein